MDTNKYNLPKHIDNDGLEDTIVEISYSSPYNVRTVESMLDKYLKEEYRDTLFQKIPTRQMDRRLCVHENSMSDGFYTNGVFKVAVSENVISFNCVVKYVGWQDYSSFILNILRSLTADFKFNEIALRYVSYMENESIFDNLDGVCLQLKQLPRFEGTTICFYPSLNTTDYLCRAKVLLTDMERRRTKQLSIIDITVKLESLKENINNSMEESLRVAHWAEKDLFFRLLDEQYVNKKNPVYD